MEKNARKQPNRAAFTRQPARVLLVDYSPPFDADTCEFLHEALVNFFSLVTHLSGPCRTPFFGLFALKSFPESLFPLQHVRGNFSRLYVAFEELKYQVTKGNTTSFTSKDVTIEGLREAVSQFRRQSQSVKQMSTSSCQLEIIFLTCRKASALTKHIETFSKGLDLENLKKIQVVSIQSLDAELNIQEDDSSSYESSPATDDECLTGCGLVDVISLEKGKESKSRSCSVLKKRELFLLAKSTSDVATTHVCQQASFPHGHFLLLPSDNNGLLLKSIAVSELMLPSEEESPVEGPSDSALSVVASCLDQLELSCTFNPLLVQSNLYKCLISQSLKNNPASKPQKRRFQAPQKTQPIKDAVGSGLVRTNQQAKGAAPRAQVRPVVFTNSSQESSCSQVSQMSPFKTAASVFSSSKRFRQNSAANLYRTSATSFPDNL
ncbi:PREDICTED: meiosis 1 arrest protein-like [Acropora digitifera]|uniref:meiosis 1 arrest protein-like n=1 Tax=Acropora digitifera TaxID=70779 RepID=UPI00077ADD9A|nr:PREDICTED: meiosis 1 arrest protein-like [Acropora digitifera]